MGRFWGTLRCLFGGGTPVAAAPAAPSNFLDLLVGMDYAHLGEPFVQGPTKVAIDLQGMDYAHLGEPFVIYRKTS